MMLPFHNLLAHKEPFLGMFMQSASPELVEAAGLAGFSFAVIDLEHAYYGPEKAAELVRAGETAGLSMLVRVPALEALWIKKALDLGAAGVIAPNIDTPEQAAELVRLSRFAPEGIRGACPSVRANGYGAGGSSFYVDANHATAVIALVESQEGVRNFDAIVATPGLTAVFIGPVDLSVSMGLRGNASHPRVQEALAVMIAKANAAGVPVGALGMNPEGAKALFARGLNFLGYGVDTMVFYESCRQIVSAVLQK